MSSSIGMIRNPILMGKCQIHGHQTHQPVSCHLMPRVASKNRSSRPCGCRWTTWKHPSLPTPRCSLGHLERWMWAESSKCCAFQGHIHWHKQKKQDILNKSWIPIWSIWYNFDRYRQITTFSIFLYSIQSCSIFYNILYTFHSMNRHPHRPHRPRARRLGPSWAWMTVHELRQIIDFAVQRHPAILRDAMAIPQLTAVDDRLRWRLAVGRHRSNVPGGTFEAPQPATGPRWNFSGWWFEPLWKILVNWDDYSQYMGK